MTLNVGDLVELNKQRALAKYYVPEIPLYGIGVVTKINNFDVSVYWIRRKKIINVARILLIKILDKNNI